MQAGSLLSDCLRSLSNQTRQDFEIVVVDNSGQGIVRREQSVPEHIQVIENSQNVGYGSAINQAVRLTSAPYVAVLNDDATVSPTWLDALVQAMDAAPDAGMCACRVMFAGKGVLDSAAMLLCADGSSKQRGHNLPPEVFSSPGPAFFPSGSAALYRRAMLLETGGFDDDFFLYCEETDLGLRAQWAGWHCIYAPQAEAEHHYSQTAGRVSALKAYYVERNRLFVLCKNFPLAMLWRAPFATISRYFWHAVSLTGGTGAAGSFRKEGNSSLQLVFIVIRAHLALLKHGPRLLRQRLEIRRRARITARQFSELARLHSISPREVAAQ